MRRTNSTGLRLDLTENTPDSLLNSSRLPNLVVEHAETLGGANCLQVASLGENLNSKLPNVVEGSMDYGTERRSSRYLTEYDAAAKSSIYHHQEVPSSALNYGVAESGYLDRGYRTAAAAAATYNGTYDPEGLYDARMYPEDTGSLRYNRSRTYQESDLDEPYIRGEPTKTVRTAYDPIQDGNRRYSRDLTDYEFAHYAEEMLKREPKKPCSKVTYDVATTKGYDSGLKTNNHDQAYDLAGQQQAYNSVGKLYGTLPRYESSGSKYDEYERDAVSNLSGNRGYETTGRAKVYEGIKYELTTSKSYDRSNFDTASRYSDGTNNQTLKLGENSSRKSIEENGGNAQEKMNGYRNNNFEAYGVYADPTDDHGFKTDKKTPTYTYKGVVVNASGESSVVEQKRVKEAVQTEGSPWCKPTILLLLLVLVLVIFVLVAGILLYFNCKFTNPSLNACLMFLDYLFACYHKKYTVNSHFFYGPADYPSFYF